MNEYRPITNKYTTPEKDIESSIDKLEEKMLNVSPDSMPSVYDSTAYEMSQNLFNLPVELKTNEQTEAVQKFLRKANYYTGEIDGFYGNKTKAAINKYTNDHVNEHAWNKLKGSSDTLNRASMMFNKIKSFIKD